MRTRRVSGFLTATIVLAFTALTPSRVLAHCDGLDGPVVKAARQALSTGNVDLALIWIQPGDEGELREAFAKTMSVRNLNPEAKELADRYFLEALVRIHRTGEGAPYTGLKPAGRDLGPAIPAADRALHDGAAAALVEMLTDASGVGIRKRFEKALATKQFNKEDVQAGRRHVQAYVEFVHYVEGLYGAARGSGEEHPEKTGTANDRHSH
jgi:hypothetical protein